MAQIMDAALGLRALKQAGYRSTATAVAELVDNSIESRAGEIDIIALSRPVLVREHTSNQVTRIGVLDNGHGMDKDILANCLSLGWGTRLDTREGLGRFGFGLKGSSISQAARVEVYSWVKKDDVYMAYLDIDEITEQKLQELPPVEKSDLPKVIEEAFKDKLGDTGTLVLWDRLDQVDIKIAKTLLNRINGELCRIYRHFLDDCNVYGSKRNVTLHMLQEGDAFITSTTKLKANDPLYLLKPNNLPGFEEESTNVEHHEAIELPIKYFDGNKEATSIVEIRFSVAKPSIQNMTGNSDVGKHYGKNTGISFVRAGREIDFGAFGFIDRSEPRHRWWGAEVRFDPVLDELFGVTNNKQEVRSIKKLDDEHKQALIEDEGYAHNYKSMLLIELNTVLEQNIGEMMKIIKGRKAGSRQAGEGNQGVTGKVNADVINDKTPTESERVSGEKSEDQLLDERVAILLKDDSTLSEEDAKAIAKETLNYRVDVLTDDWPGGLFLDRRFVGRASVGIINRRTQFYDKFWNYLEQAEDRKGFEALEILIMALVRSEDEMIREVDSSVFETFREKWGIWVEKLIKHAGS